MSNMVLVSVFDHAVGEFAPCMCVNSEAAAIRIKLQNELKKVIDQKIDFVTIIKMLSSGSFSEENLGNQKKDSEGIFI